METETVNVGTFVTVTRGRKVPLGTTGVCIWVGAGKWGYRCGVKDRHGDVHWTSLDNVEPTCGPLPPELVLKKTPLPPAPVVAKGDTVLMEKGDWAGETGTVFWTGTSKAGNPRVGVRFGKGWKAPSDFFPGHFVKKVTKGDAL